jgi:hypothetical protein
MKKMGETAPMEAVRRTINVGQNGKKEILAK